MILVVTNLVSSVGRDAWISQSLCKWKLLRLALRNH